MSLSKYKEPFILETKLRNHTIVLQIEKAVFFKQKKYENQFDFRTFFILKIYI